MSERRPTTTSARPPMPARNGRALALHLHAALIEIDQHAEDLTVLDGHAGRAHPAHGPVLDPVALIGKRVVEQSGRAAPARCAPSRWASRSPRPAAARRRTPPRRASRRPARPAPGPLIARRRTECRRRARRSSARRRACCRAPSRSVVTRMRALAASSARPADRLLAPRRPGPPLVWRSPAQRGLVSLSSGLHRGPAELPVDLPRLVLGRSWLSRLAGLERALRAAGAPPPAWRRPACGCCTRARRSSRRC